jgi:[protein-PII] uridylyltransferase
LTSATKTSATKTSATETSADERPAIRHPADAMARTSAKNADSLIDAVAFHEAMDALAVTHGTALRDGASRKALIDLVKSALKEGFEAAAAALDADGHGLRCAERISAMMDRIISSVATLARETVFRSAPDAARMPALLAVGGYGRGTLAPFSDIDLLFLVPAQGESASKRLVEYILYLLWDCGLKVGHATRTVGECVKLARADTTICTTLLESRRLWGSAHLATELARAFDAQVIPGTVSAYIEAKLEERDSRHKKTGDTRYLVEPNVKEGKGGLRDIQTLFWIARYFYRFKDERELVDRGVLQRRELQTLRRANAFLWAVRCHLHFAAGKAEERLSFDFQREIAQKLNYQDHPGQSGVERFMKHYFLVAKDVGDLTRILCAALEAAQAKASPGWSERFGLGLLRSGRKSIRGTDFILDHGKISISRPDIFTRDPVNLIRLFHLACEGGHSYHPDALRLVTQSLKTIDDALRNDPEANRLFLEIMSAKGDPELHLRRMNEAGVLGRFVPDFGRIVAMMQFSMYHHYTVDEHTLRAVGALAELLKGSRAEDHPLATSIVPMITAHRRMLFVALFLHDIAKGRPEDHSVEGAKIARKLGPRFGLSSAETDLAAWLIDNHLVMSTVAQTRDLGDRKTIEDFATTVQSMERMRLLLVLTICDIRAVGPATWTGWKGQLLRTLYSETELLLTGGFSEGTRAARAEAQRLALAAALPDWGEADRKRYSALFYNNYLLAVPTEQQTADAGFVRAADREGRRLATMVKTRAFEGVTEITVLAPDHPRLLSIIAGACSGTGGDIVSAQIFTTTDGRAFDTIRIAREFADDHDELRRAGRIGSLIEEVLEGRAGLPETIHRQRKKRMSKVFTIPPRVEVRNALSHRYSVIEVECLDRIGLLSEITRAISDLSLDIESAQITTYGEKVVDTFYVTDLMGFKIDSPQRQKRVVKRLIQVIEDGLPGVGKNWTADTRAEASGITV